MGKFSATGPEQANQVLTGSFSATGQSQTISVYADFSFAIWGTFVGTVALEKSFDGGTTWIAASSDMAGTPISLSSPIAVCAIEVELGILYRMNCTAFTSGTINYRISASVPRTSNTTN